MTGDDADNVLSGGWAGDLIDALGGNDWVRGYGGDDTLSGGDGNDFLDGGEGNDLVQGGNGDDRIESWPPQGVDTIDGGEGFDSLKLEMWDTNIAVSFSVAANLAGNVVLADGTTIRGIDQLMFSGGVAADTVSGGEGDDRFDGGGGDDSISGGGGRDFLFGSPGDDTLLGGAGNDSLYGGEGSNLLRGGQGEDKFSYTGSEGAGDTIAGGAGKDLVVVYGNGDAGVDISAESWAGSVVLADGTTIRGVECIVFTGTSAADTVTGGRGADTLYGFKGDDTLQGGNGNDFLEGGEGRDVLRGGSGQDRILSDLLYDGGDTIDGGEGIDRLSLERYHTDVGIVFSVPENLVGAVVLANGTAISGIEQLEYFLGSSAGDTITGGDLADRIDGSYGDNRLAGGGGNDTLEGGGVSDTLLGGDGDDVIRAIAYASNGGIIDGGAGEDFAYILLAGLTVPIRFSITANLVGTEVLSAGLEISNIERVFLEATQGPDTLGGGDQNDVFLGGPGDDLLDGGGGDDTLAGGEGDDVLFGGGGDDLMYADSGRDTLDGGAGIDTVEIAPPGYQEALHLVLDPGIMATVGVELSDGTTLRGLERFVVSGSWVADEITGGDLGDTLSGSLGDDRLDGGAGGDQLYGDEGNDLLRGGQGDDVLDGGGRGDTLDGGLGADTLRGRAGHDRFLFSSALVEGNVDRIQDMRAGFDLIVLDRAIFGALSPGALPAGAFESHAGATAATTPDGRVIVDRTNGALYYDQDGVGGAPAVLFAYAGDASANLTSGDFLVVG